ncbi:winged helix-turn-helix domain-containing protein [Malaciobacter mytili]|nr:winged helix-turn-helix domain-containing protein [Malaciobacter mytili]AXH14621.1 putative PAS sensor-containing transcriptional regulator [Malaciobacter mytili LMG 24559]
MILFVMDFSIFKNLPYRVYIRDINHKIVYANELVLDILKLSYKEIINRNYEDIFMDERFILHLKKIDSLLFNNVMNSFTIIKEFNQCYKKESIFKVIDYIYTFEDKKFIVTILVEISDSYCLDNGLELYSIGRYNPSNRIINLNSGITICLTRLENSFLFLLYEKKGEVANYDEIFLAIDPENKMDKVSLKSMVYRLKKKINQDIIKNISAKGYYLSKEI